MQDIKSTELREKDPNANAKICFEARATALCPRLHTEGFPLSTIGSSTKEPPPRNYNVYKQSVYNSNSHTFTQEGRHKAKNKVKRKLQLDDHLDHKQDLVISKDHK